GEIRVGVGDGDRRGAIAVVSMSEIVETSAAGLVWKSSGPPHCGSGAAGRCIAGMPGTVRGLFGGVGGGFGASVTIVLAAGPAAGTLPVVVRGSVGLSRPIAPPAACGSGVRSSKTSRVPVRGSEYSVSGFA